MFALENVFDLKLRCFLRWNGTINILAVLTGCSLLGASMLPWLKDPLGIVYSAWQLPLYSGWTDHLGFLNYGLLCLCCALYAFLFACTNWHAYSRYKSCFLYGHRIIRHIPIVLVMLFLFQYLCTDVSVISLLANHERQMLLIQQYFGYQGSVQLVMLHPLTLNISTLWGKLQILLDCISYGPLCLCIITCLLHPYKGFAIPPVHSTISKHKHTLIISWSIVVLILLFVRIPIGMLCEYVAKGELSVGDYNLALTLLNSARFFNPELDQVAYYHREQGQAQYFLSPGQLTTDSRIYLASAYRAQADYLDAYQQLLPAWHAHSTVPWIVDEMDITLECLVESRRPLRGLTTNRISADDTALPWLYVLSKVDSSNSYAIYVTGRIQYDLHNYQACHAYMSALLQPNVKDTIRSSLYTYMAMSENALGQYGSARLLLFNAISLDPYYHNNTAREELSGLH